MWLPKVLLEDHEDLHELYISLHLQVEQMRYEPGPLLLTLMFLNYLLFLFFFFFFFPFSFVFFRASCVIAPSLRCICTGVATLTAENDCNFGH